MLKSAIIGLGTVSSVHYNGIKKSRNGELVAVCDIDESRQFVYEDIPFYSNVEKMLDSVKLDVVHICLPHHLHHAISKLCAERGVHVFQEKPLAISYKEGLETQKIAEKSDVKIGICFQNRYNKSIKELKRILEEEDTSWIVALKGLVAWNRPEIYYQSQPWRGDWETAGGGTIINQAIHTLDLMQWFGGDLRFCKASLSNLTNMDIEVEDTAVANFTYDNGTRGFYMSTNAHALNSSVEFEVVTQKATYMIKENALFRITAEYGMEKITEDEVVEGTKFYYGASHATAIQKFYDAVENDTDDYISVASALPSMLMIDAMKKSSEENRSLDMVELMQ